MRFPALLWLFLILIVVGDEDLGPAITLVLKHSTNLRRLFWNCKPEWGHARLGEFKKQHGIDLPDAGNGSYAEFLVTRNRLSLREFDAPGGVQVSTLRALAQCPKLETLERACSLNSSISERKV